MRRVCAESRLGRVDQVSSEQVVVRIPVEHLVVLDDLVARGVYDSRDDALRAGVETLIGLDQRHRDDDSIKAGFWRVPPTEAERAAASSSLRDAIAEEPW